MDENGNGDNRRNVYTVIIVLSEDRTPLFLKLSGRRVSIKKMYKKVDGRWVEDTAYSETFNNGNILIFDDNQ